MGAVPAKCRPVLGPVPQVRGERLPGYPFYREQGDDRGHHTERQDAHRDTHPLAHSPVPGDAVRRLSTDQGTLQGEVFQPLVRGWRFPLIPPGNHPRVRSACLVLKPESTHAIGDGRDSSPRDSPRCLKEAPDHHGQDGCPCPGSEGNRG